MTTNASIRVVVGMSGGVDSSVAALLLKESGYDVHGLYMTNWEEDEEGYCQSAEDLQDARCVADQLDIPLHRINFAREYRERVFDEFLREYAAGRTPNPDVICNREIKFGVFFEYARRLGAQMIATGHYARSTADGKLLMAADRNKDQTYFLNNVTADSLRSTLFPLGDHLKSDVRAIAAEQALAVHDKPDSTGICFIGERRFREFLSRYLPARPGPIIDERGNALGEHKGLMYYTIGQRQGLGIGGVPHADDAPWYVAEKRMESNSLVVVQGHEHARLMSTGLTAERAHWIAGRSPTLPLRCRVRTRHRQALQECEVRAGSSGLEVIFDHPQRAVSPGQYVVYYSGDECLGGSVIHGATDTGLQAKAAAGDGDEFAA